MKQNNIRLPDPRRGNRGLSAEELNHHRQIYELIERGFRRLDVNMQEIETRLAALEDAVFGP